MKKIFVLAFVLFALCSCGQESYDSVSSVSGKKENSPPPIEYISIKAKKIVNSPTYWSSTDGEFHLKYINKTIPRYSKVKLHYGLKRESAKTKMVLQKETNKLIPVEYKLAEDWQDIKTLPLYPHEKEINVWNISLREQLIARGSSAKLVGLQFVFIIDTPDGKTIFDKGSDTELGYYEADTKALLESNYANPEDFLDIAIKVIEKKEKKASE